MVTFAPSFRMRPIPACRSYERIFLEAKRQDTLYFICLNKDIGESKMLNETVLHTSYCIPVV
jgi:hypothetical protein